MDRRLLTMRENPTDWVEVATEALERCTSVLERVMMGQTVDDLELLVLQSRTWLLVLSQPDVGRGLRRGVNRLN